MKTVLFFALSLLALPGYGQRAFSADEGVLVDANVIEVFQGARCQEQGEATEQLEAYGLHRFRQLSAFYETMGTYPFGVYFREKPGGPLYLVFKGACRGMHVTVPVVYQGLYYVVIFDEQRPSLLVADARQQEMKVRYSAACVLH